MSRHKRQLALFRTCRRDRKVVTRLYRLAVFVDANETGVQVIPREHEIVGVAAEKGCGELRCEDQPHVLVPPVFVKIVDAAAVKRSEEHTSELQSHSFISYAVFCLKKKT